MRGQVLIALFHGVSVTIVLLVLRVPLAAPLGVLIFIGSFIPLLGLTVTGALCVAVALLEHGVPSAIAVAVAIVVLVQLEGHVLQPVIMSRTVELHPLAVALAVFAGTAVAGITGALVAVPFVAFANTFVRAIRNPPNVEPGAEPDRIVGFPPGVRSRTGLSSAGIGSSSLRTHVDVDFAIEAAARQVGAPLTRPSQHSVLVMEEKRYTCR